MADLDQQLIRQRDRALALAGVFQAAALVKQLAWKGTVNPEDLETSIYSLLQINSQSVTGIYNGKQNLKIGLQTLINLLQDTKAVKDPEIARYTISLLQLERLLIKRSNMLDQIQSGIQRAQNQANHFGITHDNVIANIAGVYTDTISTFRFRIHVSGDTACLSNPSVVNKVRTILLAGIRSAVLWRQIGGSRLHLIFGKKLLIADARAVLQELKESLTSDR